MYAGYRWIGKPPAENFQDNRRNGLPRLLNKNAGLRRDAPAEMPFREWDPAIKRWRQGPEVLPNFKPKHYFTRPSDGKRHGWMGRMKDACSGEGADVFITTSGDKRTFMRDRPQRWQWTGWQLTPRQIEDRRWWDKDFRWQDLQPIIDTKFSKGRGQDPLYNFRNREFESAQEVWRHPKKVWNNATWAEGARHSSRQPLNSRDMAGRWYTRVPPWAGYYPGGRPNHW